MPLARGAPVTTSDGAPPPAARRGLGPHLARGLDDERELGPLLVLGQRVALDGRGEAALAREAELLDIDVAAGLLDAALEVVLALEVAALGRHQAEDDLLARGHEAQRLEAPRAGVVVLEEEAVDGEVVEQRLGDVVVAALGHPRGLEVAAAQVHGDRHALGAAVERLVDVADVVLVEGLRVAAGVGGEVRVLGVVEVGEARVVELQVGAPVVAEGPDLVGVGRREVRPEVVEVGVDRVVDRRAPAAVVDHAGGGDGQLRRRGRHARLQEREVVGEDRLLQRDALGDAHRRRLPGDRAVLVVELDLDALLGVGDPAERVDEVHVPRRAAELAVGGGLQPDRLLLAHDVADGVVLDGAQLVGAEAPRGVLVSGARELAGSQERPDVVGAERGAGPGGHAVSSSADRLASSTSRRLRGARPVRSSTWLLRTSSTPSRMAVPNDAMAVAVSAGSPTAMRFWVASSSSMATGTTGRPLISAASAATCGWVTSSGPVMS